MLHFIGWVHRIGPGFLILLAALALGVAFVLEMLVSVGLPNIRGLYFLTFSLEYSGQEIKIGLWTICTRQYLTSFFGTNDGETCQGNNLGYQDSQYASVAKMLLIPGLSKAVSLQKPHAGSCEINRLCLISIRLLFPKQLAMQPLSAVLTGLAIAAAGLHLCINFVLWPLLCSLAAAASILAFVFEIILFSTARGRLSSVEDDFGSPINGIAFGAGIWLQLAAMAVVCLATFFDWIAFARRKLGNTHLGKIGKKAPSIYRASVAGSHSSGLATKSGLYDPAGAIPNSRRDGLRKHYNDGKESYELKRMAAPMAAPAATAAVATLQSPPFETYQKQRKSVPSYDDVDTCANGRSRQSSASEPSCIIGDEGELINKGRQSNREVSCQRPSESDEDDAPFEDAFDIGSGAQAGSLEYYKQYNEPMDSNDNIVISPRRGVRAARYSARMAELGLN